MLNGVELSDNYKVAYTPQINGYHIQIYKHSKILTKICYRALQRESKVCFLCWIAFEHSIFHSLFSGVIYFKIYTDIEINVAYIL